MQKIQTTPSHSSGYEELIEGLIQNQIGLSKRVFSKKLIQALRTNLLSNLQNGSMHPAGVGKNFTFKKDVLVRGDVIKWFDNDTSNKAEVEFLQIIKEFVSYLNQSCYTGINDFEFHYAYYDTGSFYRPHIDQFHKDAGRKFSFVTYLNEDWTEKDGGEFVAYVGQETKFVLPKEQQVVFFRSNEIKHEVKVATRSRMSIAGWLKKV